MCFTLSEFCTAGCIVTEECMDYKTYQSQKNTNKKLIHEDILVQELNVVAYVIILDACAYEVCVLTSICTFFSK